MNELLLSFAEKANSSSVNRLLALSQIIGSIPPEKMAKVQKLKVTWDETYDNELMPCLDLEFFP